MATWFSGGRSQRSKGGFHKWIFNRTLAIWNWGVYLKLGGHKNLEIEWTTNSIYYFSLGMSGWWTHKGKQDHHGVNLDVNLGWWQLTINFYDSRHVEHFTGENK